MTELTNDVVPKWAAMTEEQADRIHAARHSLGDILDLLRAQERDLDVTALAARNPWRLAAMFEDLGRYEAAVEAARDALFAVLNVGSSHLYDPLAKATIDRWYADVAAEKQAAVEEVRA